MESVYLVSARRTPMGRFLGSLSDIPAADLGAAVLREALQSAGLRAGEVEEVIFGCARQAGNGPNPARQVSFHAGIPVGCPSFTVNMACASALKAVSLAAQAISAGQASVIAAGGMESMSRVPFLLERARGGYRLGHGEAVDAMLRDGFTCPLCGLAMGETAENLARDLGISREEQDAYAAESQRRCEGATLSGRWREEIVPLRTPHGELGADETPRRGVTADSLSGLPPAFRPGGTVHAGNSCSLADGAAALILASERRTRELGIPPLARVAGVAAAGVEPARMGLGPVPAVRAIERQTGWKLDSFDLVEVNEAFAAQVLACDRELRLDRARLNVNGGAIALGHPVGASGARIVVTLVHEMKRRGARRGLAALCASGGLGMALALESV